MFDADDADKLRSYCTRLAARLRAVPRYVVTDAGAATPIVIFTAAQLDTIAAQLEQHAGDAAPAGEAAGLELPTDKCRACGAAIVWLKSSGNRNVPVDAATVRGRPERFDGREGHVSHFTTCPDADKFRGRRRRDAQQ